MHAYRAKNIDNPLTCRRLIGIEILNVYKRSIDTAYRCNNNINRGNNFLTKPAHKIIEIENHEKKLYTSILILLQCGKSERNIEQIKWATDK